MLNVFEFLEHVFCPKMILNGSRPHPHPWRQQKSPARGQNILKKKKMMIFYGFYENVKKVPCQGASQIEKSII